MSSTDKAVYVVRITNANRSNARLKMAWFVLIFEYGKKYLDFILEGGGILPNVIVKSCPVRRSTSESTSLFSRNASLLVSVSYTHLTLPTKA